ncbi:CAD87-like protein, partial [Mya arenaria]
TTEVESSNEKQYGNITATTEVTVTIKDVDDNVPTFSPNQAITGNLTENSAEGIPITLSRNLRVIDKDYGDNAKMCVQVLNANGANSTDFHAIPKEIQGDGNITLLVATGANKTLLDYERTKKVKVTECRNCSRSVETWLNVTILDANDNDPKFTTNKTYKFWVNENSRNNTLVGNVSATDEDDDGNGNLTYSLAGGMNKFRID